MVVWNQSHFGSADKSDAKNAGSESQWTPRAGDIMQCGVVSVAQDESVYTAIGMLVERHLSGLPVINHGELVGIISEKDILSLLYESERVMGQVREYMTTEVVCFDIENTLEEIGASLIDNSFRRVAILREGKLCGVISRSDLIRHYVSTHQKASSQTGDDTPQRALQAKDVMRCGLLTVSKETSLHDAADILSSSRVTGLPVVDSSMQLQGIVSEKDILRTLFVSPQTGLLVNDIMTEDVVSFSHLDSLYEICDCLINNEFRRVPILDDGRLVGIVSRADITMFILKNRSAVARGAIRC
jgi:CBS domain-containing protein